jgi:hypothetical protein
LSVGQSEGAHRDEAAQDEFGSEPHLPCFSTV